MRPGDSHAGITVPEGDPDELRSVAATFRGIAGALERQAAGFGALPGELSSWRGAASVAFAASALQTRSAASQGAQSFGAKAHVVERLAEELEQAQRRAKTAIEDAREAEDRIAKAEGLIADASGRQTEALSRVGIADAEIVARSAIGDGAPGAHAERGRAQGQANEAAEDERRARILLGDAEDDLEVAKQRGQDAERDAEQAAGDLATTLTGLTPPPALTALGAPAFGIGASPGSPLAGIPALLPLGDRTFAGLRPLRPLYSLDGEERPRDGGNEALVTLLKAAGYGTNAIAGLLKAGGGQQEGLRRLLRESKNPAVRADAGRALHRADDVLGSPAAKVARRGVPVVGAGLDYAADRAEGRGPVSSALHTASKALGAIGGGAACVGLGLDTLGAGLVACPALVTGGAEGAGWLYDRGEKAVSGDGAPRPRPPAPLVPLEVLGGDAPPLKSHGGLMLEQAPRLKPLGTAGG